MNMCRELLFWLNGDEELLLMCCSKCMSLENLLLCNSRTTLHTFHKLNIVAFPLPFSTLLTVVQIRVRARGRNDYSSWSLCEEVVN